MAIVKPPTVFPFQANMEAPIRQSYGYRTDVITSRDGTEQRVQLRQTPRGRLTFQCHLLDYVEAQQANGILFGQHSKSIGVPMWQYMQPLTATIASGGTTVQVDTTDVPFVAGHFCILWQNQNQFQTFTIDSVTPTTVVLDAAVNVDYPVNQSWIIPLLPCRFDPSFNFSWLSWTHGSTDISFIVEQYPQMPSVTTWRLYLSGSQILEETQYQPNRKGDIDEIYQRKFSLFDNTTGLIGSDDLSPMPNPKRSFTWSCFSRAEVHTLLDFLDQRKGMAIPFWTPSWQRDLQLAVAAVGGNSFFIVQGAIGYRLNMFPLGGSRRHIMFRRRLQTIIPSNIFWATSCIPSAGNDRVNISGVLNAAYPVDTLLCFLKHCRLASDEVEIVWHSRNVAECAFPVVEDPNPTPGS